MRSFLSTGGIAAAALVALSTGAMAQAAAPAPAAAPAAAVKAIGDYNVRCLPTKGPSPCEMIEELVDKNTRQRVLGFSLAFVPSASRYAVQIAVPLGVSLPKGLVIQTDSFTSPALHYRRCDRGGCYVEMVMEKTSIDSLAHSGAEAKIKIVADNGKPFDLRFSLNGFSAAHDEMVKLAKENATAPPAPPADGAAPPATP